MRQYSASEAAVYKAANRVSREMLLLAATLVGAGMDPDEALRHSRLECGLAGFERLLDHYAPCQEALRVGAAMRQALDTWPELEETFSDALDSIDSALEPQP